MRKELINYNTENLTEEVRVFLQQQAEEAYQKFSSGLLPNTEGILGVRLPILRKLAKEISRHDWHAYFTEEKPIYFEEIMLQGMLIGCVECGLEERMQAITAFVPMIDNWSVCDSFCTGLKFTLKNKEAVWEFLQPYINGTSEFMIRFGVVMCLQYYIEDDYLECVIQALDGIDNPAYYVQMAVAWALSMCYVRYPDRMVTYLRKNNLSDWTYRKTIQKIRESLQVSKEAKDFIKSL